MFNRRFIVMLGIIGVVLALVVVLFSMRSGPKSASSKKLFSFGRPEVGAVNVREQRSDASSKIKYEKLYSQLAGSQLADVLKELTYAGIAFTTEQKGKQFDVLVDEKFINEAKNILAVKGLPSGGVKGYEIFDMDTGLGSTDFDKRIRFIRAMSGELEKAINQFQSVETSKVQIVMPEQRFFAAKQPPVTASILIRKRVGSKISDSTVYSIIQLVAGAIENLDPSNVSVIDVEGRVLSSGVFERIQKSKGKKVTPKEEIEEQPEAKEELPPAKLKDAAIVPTPSAEKKETVSLSDWLKIKSAFEKDLEKKASKQLASGVLAPKSFRLTVTADLDKKEDKLPVIRNLSVSILVDSNEMPELTKATKKQIFATVAGAIGYKKRRDTMQLSLADFSAIEPEPEPTPNVVVAPVLPTPNEPTASKKGALGFFSARKLYVGISAALAVVAGALLIRKRRQSKSTPSTFAFTPEKTQGNQDQDRVLKMTQEDPRAAAELIEQWVKEGDL